MNETRPHDWYAARITGQATQVSSKKMIIYGPQGGSHQYRVPDIDGRMNIEVALDALDLEYFLPMLHYEIPHRRKRGEWITLSEPIIPGYVFVRHITNWRALEQAEGVVGILRCGPESVRIPGIDIHRLRMAEWECYLDFERKRQLRLDPPKKRLGRKYIEGSRHSVIHKRLGRMDITISSVTSRNTIKAIADKLGKVEIGVDDIEKVA